MSILLYINYTQKKIPTGTGGHREACSEWTPFSGEDGSGDIPL